MKKHEIHVFIEKTLSEKEIDGVGEIFRRLWTFDYGSMAGKGPFLAFGEKVVEEVPYDIARSIGNEILDLVGRETLIQVNIRNQTHTDRFFPESWPRNKSEVQ